MPQNQESMLTKVKLIIINQHFEKFKYKCIDSINLSIKAIDWYNIHDYKIRFLNQSKRPSQCEVRSYFIHQPIRFCSQASPVKAKV